MPRDFYEAVLGTPDNATDAYTVLEGIRVSVFARGTTDPVTVYQRETGVAQGPSPEAGSTGGPNPFFTGPTGSVQLWCDAPGRYDIQVSDTVAPPRLGTRVIPWNAIPIEGVPEASLAQAVLDAFIPIGGQLPYAGDNDPPGGRFLMAEGRLVLIADYPIAFARWGHKHNRDASGNMVDPGGGRFRIPDKRGRSPLGADNMGTAQGSAGRLPSLVAALRAPGNAGGSDTHLHTANIPSHTHSAALPNHVHPSPDHYHLAAGLYTGDHSHGAITGAGIGASVGVQSLAGGPLVLTRGAGAGGEHQHGINADGNIGVYGNVSWASSAMGGQNTGNPTSLPAIVTGGPNATAMSTDPASLLHNYELDNWIVRMK